MRLLSIGSALSRVPAKKSDARAATPSDGKRGMAAAVQGMAIGIQGSPANTGPPIPRLALIEPVSLNRLVA